MIHHCKAVSRGAKSPFLVGGMPFGSFEASEQSAVENAVRIIKEGGMEVSKGKTMLAVSNYFSGMLFA